MKKNQLTMLTLFCLEHKELLSSIFFYHRVSNGYGLTVFMYLEGVSVADCMRIYRLVSGEFAKCSSDISRGQCDVSKRLAKRHILKSIVKKLKENKQDFRFYGT